MTGHVIYTCHCLNIGIHISKKYCLDGHEKYKRDKFVTLEGPAISGWKFELDKKGVIAKYPSLVCVRHNKDNTLGWITFSCRNCNSGDVYSVKRPEVKLTYPIDTAIMSQVGDQVIIQKGAICGKEIDNIRKNSTYSSTFQIVLNPDLPVNHSSLETEEVVDGEFNRQLLSQQKQVQQLLKQSLIELKENTERKIQLYQQEQERQLNREQDKAKYDGAVLWQAIKEVSRTVKEEEKFIKSLNLDHTNSTISQHTGEDEEEDHASQNHQRDLFEEEMSKRESHVHFSHQGEFFSHHNQHNNRRRSSAIKRDLFEGSTVPVGARRRSSYMLDESAIAKSFKKDTPSSETIYELPSFRRRSSLNPSVVQSIHPLADNAVDDPEVLESGALPSNSSFLYSGDIIEEEEEPNLKEDDDDSEDMFALDEEMEELEDDLLISNDRRLSSRRSSAKYINEEDIFDNAEQVRVRPEDANIASSLPISILHSTPAYANSKIHPINVMYYPSNPSKEENRSRQKSFVGFDSAEADRETSSQLAPLDDIQRFRRKSSSAITLLNNKKNNHYKQEYSNRDNIMNLNFFNEEDEEGGPMIPPHILAANTVTDEKEAIFGSVPHNSVRHRPLE